MRKIFLFLLVGMFMLSFASAWEFDNYYSYDESTRTASFKNGLTFGSRIAEIKLNTPLDYHVTAGYNYVFELELWGDVQYSDFVRGIYVHDKRKGFSQVARNIDLKYFNGYETKYRDITGCVSENLLGNGTVVCQEHGVVSTEEYQVEIWDDLLPRDLKKNDHLIVRGYTNVEVEDSMEWYIDFFGAGKNTGYGTKGVKEWAVWTADLNVNITNYFKFDEQDVTGSGVIIDSVGNNNATNNGASNSTGKILTAYDYSSDYIELSLDSVPIGGQDRTFNLWVNSDDLGNFRDIITYGTTSGLELFHFRQQNNGRIWFQNQGTAIEANASLSVNTWEMITMTYDGTDVRLYLNATLVGQSSMTLNTGTTNPLRFGVFVDAAQEFWDGGIDEAGIWNRTLDQSEITQIFNNGLGISFTDVFTSINVTLNTPVNEFESENSTVIFNSTVNATGLSIVNVSLLIDGIINETNTSGVLGEYVFQKDISIGQHSWSIRVFDNESGQTDSTTNEFTIKKIDVILNSPDENTTATSPEVIFNASINFTTTNLGLKNITLFTNETGFFEARNTSEVLFYDSENQTQISAGSWTTLENAYDRDNSTAATSSAINAWLGLNFSEFVVDFNLTLKFATSTTDVARLDGFNGTDWVEFKLYSASDDIEENITVNQSFSAMRIFHASGSQNLDVFFFIVDSIRTTEITQTFERTINSSIVWNIESCDEVGYCEFAPNNRTLLKDTLSPNIDVESPVGTLDFNLIGGNETLNVTFTDDALDMCWFDYNGTNITIDGCISGIKNSTNFILEENNFDMTVYANDTFGSENSSFISWSYFVFENSQTFNSETTEGSTEIFSLNYTANETPTSINFIYNGTVTSADIDASNFPLVISTESIVIPNVDSITNLSFFWNIISSSSNINISANNQTVNILSLDNCSSFTNVLFNYTIVDEATQVILNGSSENVSLEVDIVIFDASNTISIINFSTEFSGTNPNSICSLTNLLNGSSFILDSTAKYSSADRQIEYHNIRGFAIDNSTNIQNITLFDIKISESTEFQITFKNSDFVVVEGALIQVNRQYVSEGVFKTVELPITDSNGQTVVHLVQNNVVYNYIVTKDNEVIGTFNNLVAFCDDASIGQCFILLNALQGTTPAFNPDVGSGITVLAPTFNDTTRDLSFMFTTNDGSVRTVSLASIKMDQIGNTSVCNTTITSSSGTLTCNVPASIGNETIIVTIFVDGLLSSTSYFKAANDIELGVSGVFLMLFLVISLAMMFSESKSMIIVGVILGFVTGGILFFIQGGIIGGGSAVMWLIIMGVIMIWKLNSEGQT